MADNRPKIRKERKRQRERAWGGGGKNPKIWTQSLFKHFNPFALMVPGASMAGTGPAAGKSDSPSQCIEEKTANHLNRNWNLFTCGLFPPPLEGHHSVLKHTLDIIWQATLFC